jgi:hypothetical protein
LPLLMLFFDDWHVMCDITLWCQHVDPCASGSRMAHPTQGTLQTPLQPTTLALAQHVRRWDFQCDTVIHPCLLLLLQSAMAAGDVVG